MPYPAAEIDATINKQLDVSTLGVMSSFQSNQFAASKSANQLSNLTDNIFAQLTQLYQAKAAQTLETDKLATQILAQRSAGGQPQSPATNAGVNSGGPAA